jgi:hypothetical protein
MIPFVYKMLKAFINGEEFDEEVLVPWWEVGAILILIGLGIYLAVR